MPEMTAIVQSRPLEGLYCWVVDLAFRQINKLHSKFTKISVGDVPTARGVRFLLADTVLPAIRSSVFQLNTGNFDRKKAAISKESNALQKSLEGQAKRFFRNDRRAVPLSGLHA